MISCNHGQPLPQVGAEACEVLERDGLVIQQIEQVIVHFGAADIGHDTDALLVLAKPLLQLPELVGCLAGPGQQGRVGFGPAAPCSAPATPAAFCGTASSRIRLRAAWGTSCVE